MDGEYCTPLCDSGYQSSGSRTCISPNIADTFQCTPKSCVGSSLLKAMPPTHGSAGECGATANLPHGEMCSVACNAGYEFANWTEHAGARECSFGAMIKLSGGRTLLARVAETTSAISSSYFNSAKGIESGVASYVKAACSSISATDSNGNSLWPVEVSWTAQGDNAAGKAYFKPSNDWSYCDTMSRPHLNNKVLWSTSVSGPFTTTTGRSDHNGCGCGTYPSWGGQCSHCKGGYINGIGWGMTYSIHGYLRTESQSSCNVCPEGKFKDRSGKHSCAACPAGFSFTSASTACAPCSVGKYQESTTALVAVCKSCIAGKQFTSATEACEICSAGKYQDQDSAAPAVCGDCPIGRAIVDSGTQANKHDARSKCQSCEQGQFAANAVSGCVSCAVGLYQEASVAAEYKCKSCAIGTEFKSSSVACDICPAGKYQNETLAGIIPSCKFCEIGKSFVHSTKGCVFCENGQYQSQSTVSSVTCKTCGAGQASLNRETDCVPCDASKLTFQELDGATVYLCKTCVPGRVYVDVAAACKTCGPGFAALSVAAGEDCKECATGRYEHLDITDEWGSCKICTRGKEWIAINVACKECDAGQFRTDVGIPCAFCAKGRSYVGTTTQCTACAEGKYQNRDDNGEATCLNCPAGKKAGANTSVTCVACDQGRYRDQESSQSMTCSRCRPGTEFIDAAAPCNPCPLGKFSTGDLDGIQCSVCAAGEYTNEMNATECKSCMAGTSLTDGDRRDQSKHDSEDDCIVCGAGKYKLASSSGGEECLNCDAGTALPPYSEDGSRRLFKSLENTYSVSEKEENEIWQKNYAHQMDLPPYSKDGSRRLFKSLENMYSVSEKEENEIWQKTYAHQMDIQNKKVRHNKTHHRRQLGSCKPPSTSTSDSGYPDSYRGWYDVQGCGKCNDYCRWVGDGGSGGDPTIKVRHGTGAWWSCREAGSSATYSHPNTYGSWGGHSKCSAKGATAPTWGDKKSDGNSCSSSSDCSSNSCRGNCCGTKGKSTGCTDCDSDGDCGGCSAGFYLSSFACFQCAGGKTSFAGSSSSASCVADADHHDGNVVEKKGDGGVCDNKSQCSSNDCRGSHCCGTKGRSEGCTNCDGDGDCSQCRAGFYLSSFHCQVCPTGTRSVAGSTSSSDCKQLASDQKKIEADRHIGKDKCRTCGAGKWNDQPSVACKDCVLGTSLVDDGTAANLHSSADNCVTCLAGTFGDDPTTTCQNCPEGTTLIDSATDPALHSSLASCIVCSAGKYNTDPSTTCETCSAGKFLIDNVVAGSVYESAAAHESKDRCLLCPAGRYSVDSSQACLLCPVGTSLVLSSSSLPTERDNLDDCSVCGAGRYSTDPASVCQDCPLGTTLTDPGLLATQHDTVEDCQACDAGQYNGMPAQKCQSCPEGKYNNLTSQTLRSSCKNCERGFSTEGVTKEGAPYCTVCAVGKQAQSTGMASCEICGVGSCERNGTECVEIPSSEVLETFPTKYSGSQDAGNESNNGLACRRLLCLFEDEVVSPRSLAESAQMLRESQLPRGDASLSCAPCGENGCKFGWCTTRFHDVEASCSRCVEGYHTIPHCYECPQFAWLQDLCIVLFLFWLGLSMYYLISKHESKKKKDAQVLKLLFQHLPILAPLIGLINWDIDLIPANIRAILQLITKIINFLIGELLTSPDCTLRTLPRDRWLIGMSMILIFLLLAAISYTCRRSRVGNDIHTAMFKMYQDILFRPVVVMTMLVWHCTDRGDGKLISSQMIGGGLDGSVCPIDFNDSNNEFTLALFFMLINVMVPLMWEIVNHLERNEGSGVQESLTLNLKKNEPFRYWSLVVTIQKLLVLVPLAVAIRQDDDGCKIRPPWTQMWTLIIVLFFFFLTWIIRPYENYKILLKTTYIDVLKMVAIASAWDTQLDATSCTTSSGSIPFFQIILLIIVGVGLLYMEYIVYFKWFIGQESVMYNKQRTEICQRQVQNDNDDDDRYSQREKLCFLPTTLFACVISILMLFVQGVLYFISYPILLLTIFLRSACCKFSSRWNPAKIPQAFGYLIFTWPTSHMLFILSEQVFCEFRSINSVTAWFNRTQLSMVEGYLEKVDNFQNTVRGGGGGRERRGRTVVVPQATLVRGQPQEARFTEAWAAEDY